MLRNIKLTRPKISTWRRIALGTWNGGGDPSVYGILEIDATNIQKRIEAVKSQGKKPPTYTVITAKAVAMTLAKHPQINGLIRWGKIYLRDNVQVFLQAAADDDGAELSGVVIQEAEKKTLDEITEKIKKTASAIRTNKDPTFKKTKSIFGMVPIFLMHTFLNAVSFILYTLNLNPKILGMPHDPFGSVMVTSIGSIGLDQGFAPLVPYSRVPILLAVGRLKDKPIVENKEVKIQPILTVCVTFDHRFIDGVYSAKMAKSFRHFLETNEGLDTLGLRV